MKLLQVFFLAWMLSGSCVALASIINVDFEVSVSQRETHSGTGGGSRDYNWINEDGFTPDLFSIRYQIDTSSFLPESSFLSLSSNAQIVGGSPPPHQGEIESYVTPSVASFSGADASMASSIDLATRMPEVSARFVNSRTEYNRINLIDSTAFSAWSVALSYLDVEDRFSSDQHINAYLLSVDDYFDYLEDLSRRNAEFTFSSIGWSVVGNAFQFFAGEASIEGVRYSGSATIASVSKSSTVPTAPTLWLITIGWLMVVLYPKRGRTP